MSAGPCVPPPPEPPNWPVSDWGRAVRGNCFTNIRRLGRWVGGTTAVAVGSDPASHFEPVLPGSLGGGSDPPAIYVVVHGWAPTYRSVVDAAGGDLRWWGSKASAWDPSTSMNRWTSDWAWSPVEVQLTPTVVVNASGMLQSIAALHPDAVILAYSWIDESATDSILEPRHSQAYTHVNGMRLAAALQQAIAPSFWSAPGDLRIIGHSHGSKVATVAALTLQQRGRKVTKLTICDAPESTLTVSQDAANLLGFYLNQLEIADPAQRSAGETFVDNYMSWFGVGYAGAPQVDRIAAVALDATRLYSLLDWADLHAYAATWYGGAAAGAAGTGQPPLGLSWPPPPSPYRPALNQTWPGTIEDSQWELSLGTSSYETNDYGTDPLTVSPYWSSGNVSGDPSAGLVFTPTDGAASTFEGSYANSSGSGAGIAIDLEWEKPMAGDYLVVMAGYAEQDAVLVVDGMSQPAGQTSIAISSSATSGVASTFLWIYFVAADGNHVGTVTISNFRLVTVKPDSARVDARRLALASAAAAERTARAPEQPGSRAADEP